MLHGIGVGNMLPAWVPVVCVDINPAVVTKLADRGSSQTVGLVTDVGLFLHQLVRAACVASSDPFHAVRAPVPGSPFDHSRETGNENAERWNGDRYCPLPPAACT